MGQEAFAHGAIVHDDESIRLEAKRGRGKHEAVLKGGPGLGWDFPCGVKGLGGVAPVESLEELRGRDGLEGHGEYGFWGRSCWVAGFDMWLVEVEKDDLGRVGRVEPQGAFRGDRCAVAGAELHVIQGHGAFSNVNPGMAAGCQGVKNLFASLEATDPKVGILIDRNGAVLSRGRGHPLQASGNGVGQGLLLVPWGQSISAGSNPDLEQMNRVGRGGIELAVLNT